MKKKFLFFIFSLIFLCAVIPRIFSFALNPAPGVSYAAEPKYARVISGAAMLYRTDSGLENYENHYFLLPEGYYVYLDDVSNPALYKVTYDVFSGYVKAEDVDIVSYTPKLKYASGQTLKIQTADGSSCNLREFPVKASAMLIENGIPDETADIKFFNYVTMGEDKWYFVEYQGQRGYVFGNYAVITEVIAVNDGTAEPEPKTDPVTNPSDPKPLDTLTIVILAAVIGFPALIILILLFKPRRRRRPAALAVRRETSRVPRYLDEEE